ncbi:conjugative transfer protein MobI(A/C) [Salinisphaera japonica]|uniref:conjugative transfer protein MobI(A/C) n=1 Tax=Salinisphaera japonica TaxID=1304270 RepID=UPI001C86559F
MKYFVGIHADLRQEIDQLYDEARNIVEYYWQHGGGRVNYKVAHFPHCRKRGVAFEVSWKRRNFFQRSDGSWYILDKHLALGKSGKLSRKQLSQFNSRDKALAIKTDRELFIIRQKLEKIRRVSKIIKAYERQFK